jgi:hypothetical protein
MNSLSDAARSNTENAIGSLERVSMRRRKTIHVLFLGSMDHASMVHDVLLDGPNFRLTVKTDYRELWSIQKGESIQVVILHNTLNLIELEDSSRYIRQRWPHARILIIRREEGSLEDALYDERVAPVAAPEVLLTTIDRLTGGWHERVSGEVEM